MADLLEIELRRFAQDSRSMYSRYADDITFSTTLKEFPKEIALLEDDGSVYDKTHKNVALSKSDFANLMNKELSGGADIDLSGFYPFFEQIEEIV